MFRNSFQNITVLMQTSCVVVVLKIWNLREYSNREDYVCIVGYDPVQSPGSGVSGLASLEHVYIVCRVEKKEGKNQFNFYQVLEGCG